MAHRDLQLVVLPLPKCWNSALFLPTSPSLCLRLLWGDSLSAKRFRVLPKANGRGRCSAPSEMKYGMYFIFSTLKGGDLTKEKNEIGFVCFCASFL